MKRIFITRFFTLSFLLLLTACTMVVNAPPPQNLNTSWDKRQQTLSDIHRWNVKGLIAFRTKDQANTANFDWQQNNQMFTMTLFGPLGTSPYRLSGRPGKVQLDAPNGQHFNAKSPESLLAQQTGWRLPVSNMYYWIRGLPVPNSTANKQFDKYHHLTQLQQDGWTVQYLRYTTSNNVDVPNKIFINSKDLSVKIVVNNWQI